ncbi:MAG: 4Fe-4S dicluster domain-containing protein, partial [bacterium]
MGEEIVISDIKQCLNCGNCIAACERRHKDISRHRREGSALIGISLVPNLCRICRDPKCMQACNRNGLERDKEGHVVVTDNCVGCG